MVASQGRGNMSSIGPSLQEVTGGGMVASSSKKKREGGWWVVRMPANILGKRTDFLRGSPLKALGYYFGYGKRPDLSLKVLGSLEEDTPDEFYAQASMRNKKYMGEETQHYRSTTRSRLEDNIKKFNKGRGKDGKSIEKQIILNENDYLVIRQMQTFVDQCRDGVEQGLVDYGKIIKESIETLTWAFNIQPTSLDKLLQHWRDNQIKLLDIIGCNSRSLIGVHIKEFFIKLETNERKNKNRLGDLLKEKLAEYEDNSSLDKKSVEYSNIMYAKDYFDFMSELTDDHIGTVYSRGFFARTRPRIKSRFKYGK